jgi:hypothetical protein
VTGRRALAVVVALGALTTLTACGDGSGDGSGEGDAGRSVDDTTSTTQPVRPAGAVRVFVINGAGIPDAAATKADELRRQGYAIAGIGNAEHQQGTVVACRRGFVAEAAALAAAVGSGTTIVPFPQPAPAGVEEADCMVGLGVVALGT